MTPKTVLPLFYAVGLLFALFGGLLIWANSQVQELILDYSQCGAQAPACGAGYEGQTTMPSDAITSYFKNATTPAQAPRWCKYNTTVGYGRRNESQVPTTVCHLQFQIPDDLQPPVLLYYKLTNFYQNHRRYVQSFDQDQLQGKPRDNNSISHSDCDPLRQATLTAADGSTYQKPYYPCGLIANSMFNDTFFSPIRLQNSATYNMTNKGIAWGSDSNLYGETQYTVDQVVPPPNWALQYPSYNESFPFPDLKTWEEFQVWMRTAGLPTFSKLALRNDALPMLAGTYSMEIYDCELRDGLRGVE